MSEPATRIVGSRPETGYERQEDARTKDQRPKRDRVAEGFLALVLIDSAHNRFHHVVHDPIRRHVDIRSLAAQLFGRAKPSDDHSNWRRIRNDQPDADPDGVNTNGGVDTALDVLRHEYRTAVPPSL
jgi:hypothetical protein